MKGNYGLTQLIKEVVTFLPEEKEIIGVLFVNTGFVLAGLADCIILYSPSKKGKSRVEPEKISNGTQIPAKRVLLIKYPCRQ